MQLESVVEQPSNYDPIEFHDEREKSRESMRCELETYLESLKVFSGSNGQNLVSIPSNLDLISDAMDRGKITAMLYFKVIIIGMSKIWRIKLFHKSFRKNL